MKVVVFVDDSKTVLMSAESVLAPMTEAGQIELKLYSNPLELLKECRDGKSFDMLITDVNMPEMDGLEMVKTIKTMPHLRTKPALALTTESSEEMKQTGKQIGLTGWIVKPFSPEKLTMGIKRVLRLR